MGGDLLGNCRLGSHGFDKSMAIADLRVVVPPLVATKGYHELLLTPDGGFGPWGYTPAGLNHRPNANKQATKFYFPQSARSGTRISRVGGDESG